jgi:hypothetical protein
MRIFGRAAALAAAGGLLCAAAEAGEELLVRHKVDFADCPASIAGLLLKLDARPDRIRTEIDTAAILRVKLVSIEANLVFHCSRTAGTLDMLRTTPGELVKAGG